MVFIKFILARRLMMFRWFLLDDRNVVAVISFNNNRCQSHRKSKISRERKKRRVFLHKFLLCFNYFCAHTGASECAQNSSLANAKFMNKINTQIYLRECGTCFVSSKNKTFFPLKKIIHCFTISKPLQIKANTNNTIISRSFSTQCDECLANCNIRAWIHVEKKPH